MPKKIEININKFIKAYQTTNRYGGYKYTINELAILFKISPKTTNTYRKKFGLSRNKRGVKNG